jgi:two-component system catabolic regulation response regulator CreB
MRPRSEKAMRGLLVEDDRAVAEGLRRLLEREGLDVDHVMTLARARERLAKRPYDFLLLDRCLPDGDSVELCRERRSAGDQSFIAFVTGRHTSDEEAEGGYAAGANFYFLKGDSPRLFGKHVRMLVEQLHRPRALGRIRFDPSMQRVFYPDGTVVDMTVLETRFLLAVVNCAPHPASEDALTLAAWGGSRRERSGIASLAARVREKLGTFDWMLEAVQGEGGYVLRTLRRHRSAPVVRKATTLVPPPAESATRTRADSNAETLEKDAEAGASGKRR